MARLANALVTLRAQVDAAHPGRAKFNDGWIGDAAHQARKSDHNPNSAGVVQAVDLSHDPAHGFDSYAFADVLRQKRDPRIKYVISNRRIFSSSVNAWEWRPYSGADDHSHHVHVSASDDPARYDDARKWDVDPTGTEIDIDPPPVMKSTVDDATRHTMARHILDFEARRDKAGNLEVYALPANDGGGSYEVAGINEKYDGPEAAKLREMVRVGQFVGAETEAEDYILQNTNPAAAWTTSAGVEFYLRDCVFNRGATGAAKILQFAVGVSTSWSDRTAIDGKIGPISRGFIHKFDAKPADLLAALREARESYERNVVGYRANFWNGLVNRWNAALVIAKTYPLTPAPVVPTAPAAPPGPATPPSRQDLILQILIDEVERIKSLTIPPTQKDTKMTDATTATAATPALLQKLVDQLQSLAPQPAAGGTAAPAAAVSPDLISKLHGIVAGLANQQAGGGVLSHLSALQGLNLPVEIVHTLETIVNFLPAVAKFVPQLQPAVPFVPLIEGGLNLVEELQSTPPNDPHAAIDTIVKHLQATAAGVAALKGTFSQPASPTPVAA